MEFEIDGYNALKAALHTMCAFLSAQDVPRERVFDSKLVANELLTNVLRHGGKRARLSAELKDGEISISVKEEGGFRPPEKSVCSDVDAECGRGLYLIDCIGARSYSEERGVFVVIRMQR